MVVIVQRPVNSSHIRCCSCDFSWTSPERCHDPVAGSLNSREQLVSSRCMSSLSIAKHARVPTRFRLLWHCSSFSCSLELPVGTSWCCWLPVLQIDDVMFVVSSFAVVLLPGPRAHLRTLRALPSCSEPPAFASLAVSLSSSRWGSSGISSSFTSDCQLSLGSSSKLSSSTPSYAWSGG